MNLCVYANSINEYEHIRTFTCMGIECIWLDMHVWVYVREPIYTYACSCHLLSVYKRLHTLIDMIRETRKSRV